MYNAAMSQNAILCLPRLVRLIIE